MKQLTASHLQLYDHPGKGAAAREINKAVKLAAKEAIRDIGRRYTCARDAGSNFLDHESIRQFKDLAYHLGVGIKEEKK